ncbi:hypothetical protein LOKO_00192 [Halomonas chromatireducens]|uniref:Uncharacterized protein n=1 Tax=Halomonas chromatireducens TaxID=507626 RepID=A0A0X8HB02_9GAMM|nr:hypothetical protein [Halomonas chromatireducens]AMC99289.1 hypothetical protein LOKO_00192 [Halomonas chromatireducens]
MLGVLLAYMGGNLIATFAIGETGELSTRASLFLNAFLIIELLKAAVRYLHGPTAGDGDTAPAGGSGWC